ncbi:protein FAM177A1 [Melanotaenia boesemani]|uniref:protein FAM177A1 n=1 Tax=Melanotaenia boesemani TaxID=1250792 RepID=UPI001C056300|nr:protein FAM177A1 [Melanotaenia boesemani]
MNSNQETPDIHETEFGGSPLPKQKKIIHFSSGETLEVEDSEDEEEEGQTTNTTPFEEPAEKTRLSFKNVATLVGRMSLLACDFLGERLAGALGLNSAKYQYAIDLHRREHKTTDDHIKGEAETMHFSPSLGRRLYGATEHKNCPSDPKKSCDEGHMDRQKGCLNRGYQEDENNLK